jgi:hypothetical protein
MDTVMHTFVEAVQVQAVQVQAVQVQDEQAVQVQAVPGVETPSETKTALDLAYYQRRVAQLSAFFLDKDRTAVRREVEIRWKELEQEFEFYQRTGKMGKYIPARDHALKQGFTVMSGSTHALDPKAYLYIAMIKERMIQLLCFSFVTPEFVAFFKLSNPTWFKQGGMFTLIVNSFL